MTKNITHKEWFEIAKQINPDVTLESLIRSYNYLQYVKNKNREAQQRRRKERKNVRTRQKKSN